MEVTTMQSPQRNQTRASLPGPSRRITVEPIEVPAPAQPRETPAPEREPDREPAPRREEPVPTP
ncbi:MAG TPA: hypothetical protein VHF51_04735 [Solirubrobacteraceae bacterium]|nr:hypothetical protein [Solirubrobacteraceae bacterium]